MSTQDILAELPRLSQDERTMIADALSAMDLDSGKWGSHDVGGKRKASLHAGAWQVADDFDAALPDGFWLGEDA